MDEHLKILDRCFILPTKRWEPPELQALYRKRLNDIFDVKHPEYYAKHVAYYFIYQRIRYELGSGKFDDQFIKGGR